MYHLLSLSTALANGPVTIKIGDNVWTFGWNFIIYLIVAAIVGFVAEFIVGWRLPLGFVGAIIAAIIGIWLMTQVIIITGLPDVCCARCSPCSGFDWRDHLRSDLAPHHLQLWHRRSRYRRA